MHINNWHSFNFYMTPQRVTNFNLKRVQIIQKTSYVTDYYVTGVTSTTIYIRKERKFVVEMKKEEAIHNLVV